MKTQTFPQLCEVLLVLNNINDNLRRIDDHLIEMMSKPESPTQKHIVVIKKEKPSIKEQK